ncbi:MAG: ATP phosphoribosyltransferase catalytic subunit HisG [Hyphomicrobium sp.]|jgi:ATP phosphoribosyltransferase|nr:ATP phosphoribosyltransferase catalytic subunit HisG [Hyphomicrobium sp.]PPD08984.1 MAG: ATP phosphoribosyltransferase [Hyphomicrobium sp.]
MTEKLLLAVPSKGRLMEQTIEIFANAGLTLRKTGNERGYRGEVAGLDTVEVAFISASEIAWYLKTGRAHMGVTGEDLIREQISDASDRVTFLKALGFGHADVVVAVPNYWIDVRSMADLDEIAATFRREHGRWFRVATKYINTTRRFFAEKGVIDYRIIESLGATEGAPAAGTADLIVDITSTGATLAANGLRILDDGIILKSEANLVASKVANWSPAARQAENEIMQALGI